MKENINSLYITYDGLSDPLGQSQILPLLRKISKEGINLSIISYEKNDLQKKANLDKSLKEIRNLNIDWIKLRYHKKPFVFSSLYDLFLGILNSFIIVKKNNIKVVHSRSYIPALIGLILKKIVKIKFIFDMRGFWADERVEGGLWQKDGSLYKISKYIEKSLILNSDITVVLTNKAKSIIENFPYVKRKFIDVRVIPTFVDLELFKINEKELIPNNNLNNKFIFVYSGSLGTWYMLDEMIHFFIRASKKIENAHFLFLSNNCKEFIEDKMTEYNISSDFFTIKNIRHVEVPKWLVIANVSLFFIKPVFSKKGSCATKFVESLAVGLPVVVNSGIGDQDEIIEAEKVGIIVSDFNNLDYDKAVDKLILLLNAKADLNRKCRKIAGEYFSLDRSVKHYNAVYSDIFNMA